MIKTIEDFEKAHNRLKWIEERNGFETHDLNEEYEELLAEMEESDFKYDEESDKIVRKIYYWYSEAQDAMVLTYNPDKGPYYPFSENFLNFKLTTDLNDFGELEGVEMHGYFNGIDPEWLELMGDDD